MSVPTAGRRHLAAVPDGQAAAAAALQANDAVTNLLIDVAASQRVRVTAWQRMEIEQARLVLLDAPDLFATKPDAYVAGLIEGAARNLLDVLDAVTEA